MRYKKVEVFRYVKEGTLSIKIGMLKDKGFNPDRGGASPYETSLCPPSPPHPGGWRLNESETLVSCQLSKELFPLAALNVNDFSGDFHVDI